MSLFDPVRHVTVDAPTWSEARARDAIAGVFAAAANAFDPQRYWPRHPDDTDGPGSGPDYDLYFGAAGVVWGLKRLEELGHGTLADAETHEAALITARTRHLEFVQRMVDEAGIAAANASSATKDDYSRGLFLGDAGFQVALYKLTQKRAYLDRLYELVAANAENPICEYMWGAPGTLAAALACFRQTHDLRWAKAYRGGADALRSMLIEDRSSGVEVWEQSLYGSRQRFLGAVHGFAGNAFAIVKGFEHLDAHERDAWAALIRNTAVRTARVEDGLANWDAVFGDPSAEPGLLVQHCHGAPGIVTCLSGLIDRSDTAFDRLMAQAGELIWQAGPLAKGANICHGTAGNGYAFLKLYLRTGDELWLHRARVFAMAAIAQMQTRREETGQPRYSLWTGDIGTALYLDDCLRGTADVPTMDVF